MPRRITLNLIAAASALALVVPVPASAGSSELPLYLDGSFGGNGMKVLPLEMEITDIEPDSEGRILLGGTDSIGGTLVRVNLDGTIDRDFGFDQIGLVRDVQLELRPDGRIQLLSSTDEGRYLYTLNESGQIVQGPSHSPLSQGGHAAPTPEGGLWLWRDEGSSLVLRRFQPGGAADSGFTPLEETHGECEVGGPCYSQSAAGLATAADGTLLRVTATVFSRGGRLVYRVETLSPAATTPREVARYGRDSNVGYDLYQWTVRTPDGGLLLAFTGGFFDDNQVQFVRVEAGGAEAEVFAQPLTEAEARSNVAMPGFAPGGGFYVSASSSANHAKAGLRYFSGQGEHDGAFAQAVEQANFKREGLDEFDPGRAFVDSMGRVVVVGVGRAEGEPDRVTLARWTSQPEAACDFLELNSPGSLRQAARNGVESLVRCTHDARGRLRLSLTRADAKHFGLSSRTIAVGARELQAEESEKVVARLRRAARTRLAEFPGATVYFKATVSARSRWTGKRVPGSVRYGQFTVGR